MARIPRLLLPGESATYHVTSRSALPGLPLGDVEKDFFLALLRRISHHDSLPPRVPDMLAV